VVSKCRADVREILNELRHVLEQATDGTTAATSAAAPGAAIAAAGAGAAADSMAVELPLLDDTGTPHSTFRDSFTASRHNAGSVNGADDTSSCDMSIDSEHTSSSAVPNRHSYSSYLDHSNSGSAGNWQRASSSSSSSSGASLNPSHKVELYTAEQWQTLSQRMAAVMASLPASQPQDYKSRAAAERLALSSSSSSSDEPLNLYALASRLQVHWEGLKQLYCACKGLGWDTVGLMYVLTQRQLAALAQHIAERAAAASAAAAAASAASERQHAQQQQQHKKQKREQLAVGQAVGKTVGLTVDTCLPSPPGSGTAQHTHRRVHRVLLRIAVKLSMLFIVQFM
jgi:hypothetical protein